MKPQTITRAFAFSAVAIAALLGGLLTQNAIQAQEEEESGVVVGTYEPQQVADQSGLNEKLMQDMSGLQERMLTAQQEGNQQEMQQVQAEAQQIQQAAVADFEAQVEAALPKVAEDTGSDIIAVQVAYVAEGIETKDVTNEIIAEINGGVAPTQQLAPVQPQ